MRMRLQSALVLLALSTSIILTSIRLRADTGTCGGVTTTLPFTDVGGSIFFCQIAEAYFSGLTNGTSGTTYSPSNIVTREQMAAFITRTLDQSIRRGRSRAALGQWWTTHPVAGLGTTPAGINLNFVASDGDDLWVAGDTGLIRIHGSTGIEIASYTTPDTSNAPLVAMGKVFATAIFQSPGQLYMIDPTQFGGGAATTVTTTNPLGGGPNGIAFDGNSIWTANSASGPGTGSISIITPGPAMPWTSATVTTGFSEPIGILFDGSNVWCTDAGDRKLKKLDSNGGILQSVSVGTFPAMPVFDGTNIWVPNKLSNSITVVRASTGAVVATLTGNGLSSPFTLAFDGERILSANLSNSVSLWKASDLTPLGTFSTGASTNPFGACSDGVDFWVTLTGAGNLLRF